MPAYYPGDDGLFVYLFSANLSVPCGARLCVSSSPDEVTRGKKKQHSYDTYTVKLHVVMLMECINHFILFLLTTLESVPAAAQDPPAGKY